MEKPAVYEARPIVNPTEEMRYGADAATKLLEVVRKAGLAKKFGGDKEHLFYEAWQTVGKFYGASAKTRVEHIELNNIEGAKATAELIDVDGNIVGGAEAYCMRDERNWKEKPWFQLASMAQTRAGSKAFRNKFAFVASLAGFATTPAEEMDGIYDKKEQGKKPDIPKISIDDMKKEMAEWFEKTYGAEALTEFSKMTNGKFDNPLKMKIDGNIKLAYEKYLGLRQAREEGN